MAITRVTMSAINVKALARQNVRSFLNSFDTVLTDCDGVLWMHMTPLPHAADVVNLFRGLGKRVFYVTNNSTKTRDDLVEKCRALKFEATADDILCTAHLSACYLQSLDFRKKVYVIGSEAIAKELEQADISYCGIGPDPINPNIPYSVFEKDPEVAAVIVGFDEHFSYPKMVKAATYLNDVNVHFIGTNTDERFPVSNDVVIPGTGSLVRCIESCSERKAVIMGKPDEYMAKMLMERADVDPQRTLMIGDRCNTDILFGTHCGFMTLLVLTGVTALSDVEKWKRSERQEERDLVPNYYIDALGDLLPYLKELETKMS
ncbi:PREDICTED: phosphoglycolate phosphatase-like isoform X1 [Wasmannia auropunctata]|uniref:phosphoglycolate phosphatase-like isoform X1 n=2 Tax=Wasmannia auropunctata TaxID=64793 RepID=UPI0005EE01FC|nr:PREDICTED: phosphoglycolate phosphatase-like isoform X1 [Wasmannia auropunctata]